MKNLKKLRLGLIGLTLMTIVFMAIESTKSKTITVPGEGAGVEMTLLFWILLMVMFALIFSTSKVQEIINTRKIRKAIKKPAEMPQWLIDGNI